MTFVKSKLVAGLFAAGTMALSTGALGAVSCATLTTVADWASNPCVDPVDGDTLFTLNDLSGNFSDLTAFTVSEVEIGTVDIYDIGFDFPTAYAGGGDISYTVTSLSGELFGGANFDTIVQGSGANATKVISTVAGAPLLTLTSSNGSRDPANGETAFPPQSTFVVTDTFDATTSAIFIHSDNSLSTVPEPATLALLGLGIAGLGLVRRARRR